MQTQNQLSASGAVMTSLGAIGKTAIDLAAKEGIVRLAHLKWRFLACRMWRPSADMRVSYTALLRVSVDNKYVLIKNLHRKGIYAPIGGVFKRMPESDHVLDDLEFRPQTVAVEMAADLRGFVPRRNLGAFDEWFRTGESRESQSECALRELREELTEIGLGTTVQVPAGLRFRRLRTVTEGPESVEAEAFSQFRRFDVSDVICGDAPSTEFVKQLLALGKSHDGLLVASAEEIRRGRAKDGRLIAHHAGYLFQTRRIRREEPLYSTQ
jgi:hypothetical protein